MMMRIDEDWNYGFGLRLGLVNWILVADLGFRLGMGHDGLFDLLI